MFHTLRRSFALTVLIIGLTLITINITHAADDCGGALPYQGTVAPGEYTLTGNCTITGTLTVDSGTVIVNGAGYAIDGDSSYRIFDVSNAATLEIDNITLRHAHAGGTSSGGAIRSQGELTINNAVFANNVATNRGGAIYSDSTVYQTEITNSTFTNNSAIHGGAVYNHTGQMFIRYSSFSGNTASGVAGSAAGAVYTGMYTRIENSSFSDNSATNLGGAIGLSAPLFITSSTFSGNTAANGGTISVDSGLTLTSSIITNDPAVENCSGNTINDGGNNLIHGQSCDGITPISTDDPLLGAFTNGYFPLLEGSPALDAYTGCTGTDQRGIARPQGSACDIGAVEMEQVVDENTGEVVIVQPGAPAAPMLNDWMGEYQEETRGHAYGMPDDTYGQVLMWQGAWEQSSLGLPQGLIDNGVIFAVDVWILTEDGSPQFDFGGYQQICLQGEGRMIFMDATQSPRTMWEMDNTTFEDGYTCGWIPNAGTVVLIEPGE